MPVSCHGSILRFSVRARHVPGDERLFLGNVQNTNILTIHGSISKTNKHSSYLEEIGYEKMEMHHLRLYSLW